MLLALLPVVPSIAYGVPFTCTEYWVPRTPDARRCLDLALPASERGQKPMAPALPVVHPAQALDAVRRERVRQCYQRHAAQCCTNQDDLTI